MSGKTRVAPVLILFVTAGLGCSHFAEQRALSKFTEALEARELEDLRARSSEQFGQRALRRDEALDSLKMLRLPTGDLEIVEVEQVSNHERLVTAQLGDSNRRAFYRIVREEGSRKWVVDDVLLRQNRESHGVSSDKSVAEQVDLLLAVHDFLDAWNSGRNDALDATTPEFRKVLADLPPVHFARLTQRVVGDKPERVRLTSPAVTNRNTGIVRVPRRSGALVLTLKQDAESWKVADVAVESRTDSEHLPSVLKTAAAINAATDFLTAYRNGDRKQLAGLCTESFYRQALLPGELDSVPLPPGDVPHSETKIDMQPTSAEFLVPTDREIVKVNLQRLGDANDSESLPEFRVNEVTIFELTAPGEAPREMRLSVLFTGRAMLRLFGEALAHGDLAMLRKTSTSDFNRRVWQQLDEQTFADLGPAVMLPGGMRIVDTSFQGAVTEVTVDQAGRRVTYVLRERAGDVRIDDVLIESPGLPASLKEMVEILLPVRRFAAGLSLARIDLLQRQSSNDLNRHVWTQTNQVPAVGHAAVAYLRAPLTQVRPTGENELLLVLGDERFGARVLLVREHTQYVVDDVMLIAGPESHLQARLKRRLREELTIGGPPQDAGAPLEYASRGAPQAALNGSGYRHPGSEDPASGSNHPIVPVGYDDSQTPPLYDTYSPQSPPRAMPADSQRYVRPGSRGVPHPMDHAGAADFAAPPAPSASAFDSPDDFPASAAAMYPLNQHDGGAARSPVVPESGRRPSAYGEPVQIAPGRYGAGYGR